MCDAAATAVRDATSALVNAGLVLAQQVIAADDTLDAQRAQCGDAGHRDRHVRLSGRRGYLAGHQVSGAVGDALGGTLP